MTKHPEFRRLESFVYHSDGRGEHVVSVRRLTQRLEQEGARCKAAAT
jgi:hypothetical protein